MITGSTARPSWTSSQPEQYSKLVGNQACCRATSPIETIWLTGGIYPSESMFSTGARPHTWQHSIGTLAPVPAARATVIGYMRCVLGSGGNSRQAFGDRDSLSTYQRMVGGSP